MTGVPYLRRLHSRAGSYLSTVKDQAKTAKGSVSTLELLSAAAIAASALSLIQLRRLRGKPEPLRRDW